MVIQYNRGDTESTALLYTMYSWKGNGAITVCQCECSDLHSHFADPGGVKLLYKWSRVWRLTIRKINMLLS